MSLLLRIVFQSCCRNTHHKLAIDSLRHLRQESCALWRDLFLKHYESYLLGSKVPDDQFKDFKNHVLHVRENYWGGACNAALSWYERTVLALRQQQWGDAVFAAGVLSHYFSDPHMPLHTGQSEEEGGVHRPAEWSIACTYNDLMQLLETTGGGYPEVTVPDRPDWLQAMIRRGADFANRHYQAVIDHYDVAKGVKQPRAGLDADLQQRIANCLGLAVIGFARVLDRAFDDAKVAPPAVELTLETLVAAIKIPIRSVLKQMENDRERQQVEKIYRELVQTGKVVEHLPEDERMVRQLHARQVLKISPAELNTQKPRSTGSLYGTIGSISSLPSLTTISGQVASGLADLPPHKRWPRLAKATTKTTSKKSGPPKSGLPKSVSSTNYSTSSTTKSKSSDNSKTTPAFDMPPQAISSSKRTLNSLPPRPASRPVSPSRSLPSTSIDTEETARSPLESSSPAPSFTAAVPKPADQPIQRREAIPSEAEAVESEPSVESPQGSSTKSSAAVPNAGSTKRSWMPSGWQLPRWQAILPSWKKKTPTSGQADSSETVSRLTDAGTVAPETQRSATKPSETKSSVKTVANAKNGDWKFYLDEDSPIVDAPSIGPKMARRLEALHVNTVADFLALSPEEASAKLGNKALPVETIRKWQAQTRLACRTPELRGHDAQILVACGVTEPEELASMNTQELMDVIKPFLESPEAERILRGAARPDHDEVAGWIDAAQHARPLKAA